MDLANLSIKRPVFITCVALLIFALGLISMGRIGVELFPDVTFPVVTVSVQYKGAGPQEIETLVSKPLEDEISTLAGLKRVTSVNQDGVGTVVAQFVLGTDIKDAQQEVRDRVASARRRLPDDIEEPVIRRVDPSDQPIFVLGLESNLPDAQLYDLANEYIRPRLEQVNDVGLVRILGGRRRQIKVNLDREKLKAYDISATQVAARIAASGENVPAGKLDDDRNETIMRTIAQFESVKEIEQVVVNFYGNDVPVKVSDVGQVQDNLVDRNSETYANGNKSLFLYVFKQSGANTIRMADAVVERIEKINEDFKLQKKEAKVSVIRDASYWIRLNVLDVEEAIGLGILLAVFVVYLFLGSARSTIITGLAIPNSLVGAFILMLMAGFTINMMSLLAMSLAVGLLVDDAIVVRENIFRYLEKGLSPFEAAIKGTGEVRMAVVATTLTVIAVFGPVGFVDGVIGQFLKQFGLTVVFAMVISLFDALTLAPMLSAYFAGKPHRKPKTAFGRWNDRMLKGFGRFQDRLEDYYVGSLKVILRNPYKVLGASFVVFLVMMSASAFVTKTFLPADNSFEFQVKLELPPGAALGAMSSLGKEIDKMIREDPNTQNTSLTIGNRDGESNVAEIYVRLISATDRKKSVSEIQEELRQKLIPYKYANPRVMAYDGVGGGMRPFNVNVTGSDIVELEKTARALFEKLKVHPALKDVNLDYRSGKPEFQVKLDLTRLQQLGVSQDGAGNELRAQLEGVDAAKFRQNGVEYDVRVRLQDDQRNLKKDFEKIMVPNLNGTLIPLSKIATGEEKVGPAKITRQDRMRYIQINADMAPGGGMADAMADIQKWMGNEIPMSPGMSYSFVGQAEDFAELGKSMGIAFLLGILFIYLVLASLYESFVTPFTIMLALPLAICGSMVALLIADESLNIFSILGLVMLVGVASKNSILLVDHSNQKVREGMDWISAMLDAGKSRLRPILMTTMALIAGTIPIAIGLNEASKTRTSMGIAIIGGLISSTLLTLIVIPAAYLLIERAKMRVQKFFGSKDEPDPDFSNIREFKK